MCFIIHSETRVITELARAAILKVDLQVALASVVVLTRAAVGALVLPGLHVAEVCNKRRGLFLILFI